MTHIEALQPRDLFAVAETRDLTFGDHGTVKLPSYTDVQGMTATHGSIYVDAYNYKKNRRLVYKYTDAGTLDTTWGNGGYIVPRVIENTRAHPLDTFTALNLTYDARTGGLVLGFVNGDAVHIERRAADGTADAGWGTHGLFTFRNAGVSLALNTVTPLSNNRLLFTLTGSHTASTTKAGVTRSRTETDVAVVRLDRFARFDKTFSRDGRVTVASGVSTSVRTPADEYTGSDVHNDNIPTYGDFAFAADGNYRVITTREQSALNYQYDTVPDSSDYNTKTGRSTFSAESIGVSVDGNTVTPQSFLLKRVTYTNTRSGVQAYRPKLATAEGDEGVVVLANLARGNSVIHVRPGYRSASTALPASDPRLFEVYRNAAGETIVKTTGGSGLPTVGRYNPDFTLDRAFGDNGIYTESNGYSAHAADDTGRLVVALSGINELYRLL